MKKYKRSKTTNKFVTAVNKLTVGKTLPQTKFTKVLIVRGIGYRAFVLKNSFLQFGRPSLLEPVLMRPMHTRDDEPNTLQEINQVGAFEFTNAEYAVIRAGHTRDMYLPLQEGVRGATSKKDRKLVISSNNRALAANLVKQIYAYRPPSVYTGRGVRIKHAKPVRKAGKKDKQKGRAF